MKLRPFGTLFARSRINIEIRRGRLYRRYIFPRVASTVNIEASPSKGGEDFLLATISPFPLLGHQISSWIAGYLTAQDLGIAYLGCEGPVPGDKKGLFNFAAFQAERVAKTPAEGVRRLRLSPVPDERDPKALKVLQRQLSRARFRWPKSHRIYRLQVDPPRWNQIPAAYAIRQAVLDGYLGSYLRELEEDFSYVAVHVRRGGDITPARLGGDAGLLRWIQEEDFVALITQLQGVPELRDIPIRVYSLGEASDFPLLQGMKGVELRLNGDRDRDLVELTAASVLLTAPSSFSFTPALASKGVVIARSPWWHDIPNEGRWVTYENPANLDLERVRGALSGVSLKRL